MVMMTSIMKQLKEVRAERFFLVLALPFGLALLVVTPPFQAPDESVHFYRSYQVSELGLLATERGGLIGGELPSSLSRLVPHFLDLHFFPDRKQDIGVLRAQFAVALNPHEREFVDFRSSAFYSPIPYIPQAIGIAAGRFFGAGPLLLFYAGRLANLFVFLALVWASVRAMPAHAWVMALIALMPMTMFMAASVSPDSLTVAMALLFTAKIFLLVVEPEKESRFSPWWIMALALMIGLCKGYLPLLLLVFLVSPRRFRRGSAYAAWAACVLAAGAGSLAIWAWATGELFVPTEPGLSPNAQFLSIAHRPWKIAGPLIDTWLDRDFISFIEQSFVGRLGYLDTHLPVALVHMYVAALFFTALLDAPRRTMALNITGRVLCGLIALSTMLLVSAWLYITYTPPGNTVSIHGIQGRYFIPVAPASLAVFMNGWGRRMFPKLKPWLCVFIVATTLITLCVLMKRYYFPI